MSNQRCEIQDLNSLLSVNPGTSNYELGSGAAVLMILSSAGLLIMILHLFLQNLMESNLERCWKIFHINPCGSFLVLPGANTDLIFPVLIMGPLPRIICLKPGTSLVFLPSIPLVVFRTLAENILHSLFR